MGAPPRRPGLHRSMVPTASHLWWGDDGDGELAGSLGGSLNEAKDAHARTGPTPGFISPNAVSCIPSMSIVGPSDSAHGKR